MKLIPQGSFHQNEEEVIELLKRKHSKGKLSSIGKRFLEHSSSPEEAKPTSTPHYGK